ncbi:MAG: hypothetical protein LC803_02400 [Acidobacteria bacterium]|nr:hypothetical protein [Acidobacteriota bacterium]
MQSPLEFEGTARRARRKSFGAPDPMQYNRGASLFISQFERQTFMPRVRNVKSNEPCAALRLAPGASSRFALGAGLRLALCASLVIAAGACAASRDPDPARPRTNEPPYPILLASNAERRDQALAGWASLARDNNVRNEPPPELQPVTATISALPATEAPLRLPLVEIRNEDGQVRANSEEESRRESLRRFITGAGALLGVAPQNLSLVARTDEANGTRRARYQQQPFPYPLRAGFGVLDIAFTDDRRVLSLSSTAIPDTERLARALALVRSQQLTADQAVERVRGRSFTLPGAAPAQTYTVAPGDTVTPRELVVYPIRLPNDAGALELRVAWELAVGAGATPYLVYLDAVRGEIIAAQTQAPPSVDKQAGQQLPAQ